MNTHINNFLHGMPQWKDCPSKNKKNFTFSSYIAQEWEHSDAHFNVIAVIVETRPIPMLANVIREYHRILRVPIQLFCSARNKTLADDAFGLVGSSSLAVKLIDEDVVSLSEYNSLLLRPKFWDALPKSEKVLVFQSDSLPCEFSESRLSDFLKFDYIGSPWNTRRPIGITIQGGNGGLSLRDFAMSRLAAIAFGDIDWPGGEDAFFAFFIEMMGGRVATMREARRFCSQSSFSPNCFGIHKLRISRLSDEGLVSLEKHCPKWIDFAM